MSRIPNGISRKITFSAWCHRCLLGWRGPERDQKQIAAMDLTFHDLDIHGGAQRGDDL